MFKINQQSPSLQILKDCHALLKILKGDSKNKLQAQIEFEYYHYRNNLDMNRIHIRFEKAFKLMLHHKLLIDRNGYYSIDRKQYEFFISSMITYK